MMLSLLLPSSVGETMCTFWAHFQLFVVLTTFSPPLSLVYVQLPICYLAIELPPRLSSNVVRGGDNCAIQGVPSLFCNSLSHWLVIG